MRLTYSPNLSFQIRQANQNADIRINLQNASQEAVTGRRADPLEASGGRLGNALSLGSAIADIDRHLETSALSNARLTGGVNAIETIRENLSGFTTTGRVSVAQGNQTALSIVQADAEALLENVIGSLNTRIGQRHIFGGQETSVSPLEKGADLQSKIDAILSGAPDINTAIADIDQFFADPLGGFQTTSYQGSEVDGPRLHLTDTRSLSPLPKADDPIFKDILKGLTLVASARNVANEDEAAALMQAGFQALDNGSELLLNLEARLGAGQQNLEVITNNIRAERGFLVETEQNLLGRDVFEAAAELQALEGQLQASYTVTGRLGALSLANFLR